MKALKLTENDLKASSRVCSFHFFGGERQKKDVPFLEIGEKFGAKSGRKNPKDKMRQYEKNQVKQDGRKINNTSQKSPHPEITTLPVSELNNVNLKKCLNENIGRKRLLDPLEEYFMYWFRLRHSIPEKVLADLFYVSVGSVNAILKTWCILINSVFMRHFFKYP